MRLRLEIDGNATSARLDSVSIVKELDGRTSKATFSLGVGQEVALASIYDTTKYDSGAVYATQPVYDDAAYDVSRYYAPLPSQQSEIIIYNADTDAKKFRGVVVNISREPKSPTLQWWNCTCVGLEYLLENVAVSRIYTAKTPRYIIQDAFRDLLPEITTTNATVEDVGEAINFEAKDITLRTLVERLAAVSNAEFRVTEEKALVFRESGSVTAPFGFDASPDLSTTYPHRNLASERDSVQFANRVIALGGFFGPLSAELRAQADNETSQGPPPDGVGRVVTAIVTARDINNQTALDLFAQIELQRRGGIQEYVTLTADHGSPNASKNIPDTLEVGMVVPVRSVYGGIEGEYILQTLKMTMRTQEWTQFDLALGDYKPKLAESQRQLARIRVSTSPQITVQQVLAAAGRSQSYLTPGTYSWTCPADVTTVNVLLVGGGGSGGTASAFGASGGGGGAGGYVTKAVTVVPGVSYTVVCGDYGEDSYFDSVSTAIAYKGTDGSIGSAGAGGAGGSGIGDVVHDGGSGSNGSNSLPYSATGGNGGSSHGSTNGGAGAYLQIDPENYTPAGNGSVYGGGGGGGAYVVGEVLSAGVGAPGKVELTW